MAKRHIKKAAVQPFVEVGRTGLNAPYGYVQDDFLPELRDPKRRVKIFREIRDNSPVVGAALLAIEQLLRGAPITVESGGSSPEAEASAEFVTGALEDLNTPWSSVLTQALTMLEHGWAALEIIYKRRQGPEQADAAKRSKFTDGKIGWRKFAIRGQESLQRWEFDEAGGVQAMIQQPAPTYQTITLPIEKLLLFRTKDEKGSPEGRSLLRNCVLPWKFVKRIQEIEGIGIERDLAGLPVIYAPLEVVSTTAQGDSLATQNYLKQLVTSIRRDEQEGVLMPHVTDSNGKRIYELTLLTTGGTRQFDTNAVIQRYEQRMAMSMLADFVLLGHEKVGSFSLSADKTDLFAKAICAFLDSILEVFNLFAVPRLLKFNGMDAMEPPKLVHGDIDRRPLTELADYVSKLGTAGFIMPSTDGSLERTLLQEGGLPVPPELQEGNQAALEAVRQAQLDAMNPTPADAGQQGAA